MALKSPEPVEPSVVAASSASARMIERVHESVVQVRSGGRGAGVIWDAEGLVLTNHHVVAGRRRSRKAKVTLHDGQTFDAEVAKRSQNLDLTLLRIKDSPNDLSNAPVGDSDALRVGELVYAIGHPWGRLGAVTAGIVSGLGVMRGPGGRVRYIQSDVSLAPGNSGGPLLNARGEVVGVNAMIFGSLALSIPSNAASTWLAGTRRERRPRLGVGVLPVELPTALRRKERTEEAGLMIVTVEGGSPADQVSLMVGDVLLGVDGKPVSDTESLGDALVRAGDSVRLRVMRGGVVSEIDVDLRAKGPGRAA